MMKVIRFITFCWIVTACLVPLNLLASESETAPCVLRVLTYNIHHARGLDDVVNVERIAKVIKNASADLVALQEVDRNVERSDKLDIPTLLAKLTGMHVVFEKNIDFQGGEYGNAILSRYPIVEAKNQHYKMLNDGEQRGLLSAKIDVNGQHLLFMSTHIDYRRDNTERLSNVKEMNSAVASQTLPAIIAGDFNDYPKSQVHHAMKSFMVDAWEACGKGEGFTYSSKTPNKRIDYVFVSDQKKLKPLRSMVPSSDGSDHLPLFVEIQFTTD